MLRRLLILVVALQYSMFVDGSTTVDLHCGVSDVCELTNITLKNDTRLNVVHPLGADKRFIYMVYFESSELATLPEDIFVEFENLKILDLKYCGISWLKPDILFHAQKLEVLDLGFNNLTTLTEPLTNRTTSNLVTLSLRDNEMESIGDKVFGSLTKLNDLSLAYNKLTQLTKDVFKSLINLSVIDLTSNSLEYLDDDLFEFNTQLKKVRLEENKLKVIGEKLFRNNPLLAFVGLVNNQITVMDIRTKVQFVIVDHNRLTQLHMPTGVSKLYANFNNISHLSCDGGDAMLTTFFAFNNSLTSLNCIDQMANLEAIVLNHNNLGDLNVSEFNKLPKLRFLSLGATNIDLKSGDFTNLKNLKIVDLSDNQLEEINFSVFSVLSNFDSLNLSGNNLTRLSVDELVHAFPGILSINISGNNFKCDDLKAIRKKLDEKSIEYDPDSPDGSACRDSDS